MDDNDEYREEDENVEKDSPLVEKDSPLVEEDSPLVPSQAEDELEFYVEDLSGAETYVFMGDYEAVMEYINFLVSFSFLQSFMDQTYIEGGWQDDQLQMDIPFMPLADKQTDEPDLFQQVSDTLANFKEEVQNRLDGRIVPFI